MKGAAGGNIIGATCNIVPKIGDEAIPLTTLVTPLTTPLTTLLIPLKILPKKYCLFNSLGGTAP